MKLTVLVCGGRDYKDYDQVCNELWYIVHQNGLLADEADNPEGFRLNLRIVNGGARGADTLATNFAVANFCEFKEYKADWDKYKKAAGFIRNQQMLDEEDVDLVIAFPGGNGTADMVRRAKKAGIPVVEVDNG